MAANNNKLSLTGGSVAYREVTATQELRSGRLITNSKQVTVMTETENRLPTWCADDGWCPMIAASTVLGRKWHPVIIHRLLASESLGFGELEARMEGISGKVLSESLTDLEEKGLVERTVIDDKPVSVEYSLTRHGKGLADAIEDLEQWGQEYLRETTDPDKSII